MKKVLSKNEIEYLRNMLLTRDNKISPSTELAIIELKTKKMIRTHVKTGTGRETRHVKRVMIKDLELIIKILDIKHERLNDAPRGGKLGEMIVIKDERINELDAMLKSITTT